MQVYSYSFRDENKKEVHYWRDIGRIDAYFEANMDLVTIDPVFNLYDAKWPIRTYQRQCRRPRLFSAETPAISGQPAVKNPSLPTAASSAGPRSSAASCHPTVRVDYYCRSH